MELHIRNVSKPYPNGIQALKVVGRANGSWRKLIEGEREDNDEVKAVEAGDAQ